MQPELQTISPPVANDCSPLNDHLLMAIEIKKSVLSASATVLLRWTNKAAKVPRPMRQVIKGQHEHFWWKQSETWSHTDQSFGSGVVDAQCWSPFFFWAGGRSWTHLIWFGTQTPASSPKSGRRSVVTRHHCRFLNLTSSTLSHELTSMHVWCFVELIPCGSTIVLPAATVGLFWPCRTAGLSPVFSQRHTLSSSFRWPCRTCPVSSGVRPGLLLIPHSDNGSPH